MFDIETKAPPGISLGCTIPMPDLGTSLSVSLPFSFDFPAEGARYARSFTSGMRDKQGMYTLVERYVGQLGVDGHSCLLRAMCEVGSSPHHGDGLLGDMVNVVLSATNEAVMIEGRDGQEMTNEYKEYVEAQMDGKVGT